MSPGGSRGRVAGMSSPATVAAHLRQILDMAGRLEEQAVENGRNVGADGDRGLVGGEALVNLASVASKVEWLRHNEEREDAGHYDAADYEDPDELWPAEQILTWWSEDVRCRLGHMHDQWRPTLVSEAKFLLNRDVAEWIWANESHWDDYAADVLRARTKLENILREGERAERGAPCLYEECRGARLVRKLEPYRDVAGAKSWRWTNWHCPVNRNHQWDEDEYARMVWKRHQETKYVDIKDTTDEDADPDRWCTYAYAAREVGRVASTIRAWVKYTRTPRNQTDRDYPIATACIIAGRRTEFVRLADVEQRHERAKKRTRAA